MEWVKERLKEPSSYAAIGAVVLGFGVLVDQPNVVGHETRFVVN